MDIRSFFGKPKATGCEKPTEKAEKGVSGVVEDKTGQENIVKNQEVKAPISKVSVNVAENDIPEEVAALITWKAGESVPYMALVDAFDRCAGTTGRLEKESYLCNLFRSVILTTPGELGVLVHLASNSVASAYENVELGIGDSLLVKAICEATGRNKLHVEEDYKKEGDLGIVALNSRSSQKTLSFGPVVTNAKGLTAVHVFEQLKKIALTKGDKAQSRKVDLIKGMMIKCQKSEAKYLIRALQGKLRIGTANQTVLVALAGAFTHTLTPEVRALVAQRAGGCSTLPLVQSKPVVTKKKAALALVKTGDTQVRRKVINDDSDDNGNDEDEISDADMESEPVVCSSATVITPVIESKEIETSKPVASTEEIAITRDNFIEVINGLSTREPPEAEQLRTRFESLGRSEKLELAIISVKRAYSECPNLFTITDALLTQPVFDIHRLCQLKPGIPVAPMLAKPTKEIGEVLRRLNGLEFTMEYKYDGERAQIHVCEDGSIKIFSRNSEDNTQKYPDLIEVVKKALLPGVTSCVLDSEVVAYDREKQCLLPFQILSTRKRKVEGAEAEEDQKVKIILQVFDCLYLNGKSLLGETFKFRRSVVHSCFEFIEGHFHFASGMDHWENGDTTPIEAFLQEACNMMCEGLMVKTLTSNATYEPSKRSLNWLKLKKDYINGMGVCDSVDLVVMGGYSGRGKRTNVYGAYLMGCYDAENDEFQSVCKVGTGFKDEDLVNFTAKMKEFSVGTGNKIPYNYRVGDALTVDIEWFKPSVVWELQAADLSLSNVHKGGVHKIETSGGVERGIGLRFPRFIRERPDKKPENATNCDQILDMYHSQALGGTNENDEDGDDDNFL